MSRVARMAVVDSALVGEIWMPTSIKEHIAGLFGVLLAKPIPNQVAAEAPLAAPVLAPRE